MKGKFSGDVNSRIAELEMQRIKTENRLNGIEGMVHETRQRIRELEAPSLFRLEQFEEDLGRMDRRLSAAHAMLIKKLPEIEKTTERLKTLVRDAKTKK